MDGEVTWIHSDHLHSATILTDDTGAEIRRLAYRAFGEEAENIGTGEAPKFRYTGKELDSSGLMYYGARYYDPALPRFITADTVYDAGPQGLNRYSYALNNPIRYNDPSGHEGVDMQAYIGYAVGGWGSPAGQKLGRELQAVEQTAEAVGETVAYQVEPPTQSCGMVEGAMPVSGDLRDAEYVAKEGKYLYAAVFVGMAVSDVFDRGYGPDDTAKPLIKKGAALGAELGERLAKGGNENVVYRALRKGEDPTKGLRARAPGEPTGIGSHVMGKQESNFISTTKDSSKALDPKLFSSGNGVVAIDLNKVEGEIIDVSEGYGKGRVYARTKSHKEVLIVDDGGVTPPMPPRPS